MPTDVFSNPKHDRIMWFKVPPAVYFGWGCTLEALKDLSDSRLSRAFILSDRNVHAMGYTKIVTDELTAMEIDYDVYVDVSKPTASIVSNVVTQMQSFRPDCVIAMGGGSVMDIAKICRIIYDPSNPHRVLSDLFAYDHMQLLSEAEETTGVSKLPPCDTYVKKLICIPTTSGTGSEMTAIAWVFEAETADKQLALKRPIISWRMTPDIAINDGYFTQAIPGWLAASGGFHAFTSALESAVSKLANDYTYALSIRAATLILQHLPSSVSQGDQTSRSHCHNAASIAGMAAANAFVGIAHALSFVIQRFFASRPGKQLEQGQAMPLVLSQVIRFNATECSETARKYAYIADQLSLTGDTEVATKLMTDVERQDYKVGKLIGGVEDLKKKLGLNACMKDLGISESEFESNLERLAAETLKVVGCGATNPVSVTEAHATRLLRMIFEGDLGTAACTQ